MGYSNEVYKAVEKKLYNLRKEAEENAYKRRKILNSRFPRVSVIEKELSSTAVSVAKQVIRGAEVAPRIKKLKERNFLLQNELKAILKSAGVPEDYLDIKYKCNKCNDEGYVDGIMCECMKELLRKEVYDRLNSMSPLTLCSFDSFSLDYYSDEYDDSRKESCRDIMSRIYRSCKMYADNFSLNSPSILMRGNTGLGKTHLSLAIASVVIEKGYGVIYGSIPNIVSKLERERFKYTNDEEGESEKHFIGCDLLIIDDLGTEFPTSFSNAAIYNILNSRIMLRRPTIISTNLSLKELEKSYTQRMVSRIIGNNIQLEFVGTDVRQKKMKRKRVINSAT